MSADIESVIVHWNHAYDCINTIESIRSSAQSSNLGVQITVMDNASSQDQLELLEAHIRLLPNVNLVRLGQNLGFAAAANRGMSRALRASSSAILVTPHDVLLERDVLIRLLDALRQDPALGMVGADNGEEALGYWHWSHPPTITKWSHPAVDGNWLLGHCLLIRRDVLGQGLAYDERFWTWLEDVDLSLAVRELGWGLALERGAIARNVGVPSASFAVVNFASARNSLLLTYKYHGTGTALVRTVMMLMNLPRRSLKLPRGERGELTRSTLRGIVAFWWRRWGAPPT